MTANRWLWAASFLMLSLVGIVLCLLSFMGDESKGLSTPTDWSIRYPTRFVTGVAVIACALLSLRGYIVRLRYDLRARKAEPPVTTQP